MTDSPEVRPDDRPFDIVGLQVRVDRMAITVERLEELLASETERDAALAALADLCRRLLLPNGVTCRVCTDSWIAGETGQHHDWCPLHGLAVPERGAEILAAGNALVEALEWIRGSYIASPRVTDALERWRKLIKGMR